MKGAVFISDERMRYAANLLAGAGCELDLAENAEQGKKIVEKDAGQYDFVVAPIRGAIDGKMTLGGESFPVDKFLRGLDKNTPVITGFQSEYMKSLPIRLISFQDDEDFCRENGRLTAEGVLKMIIEDTKESIFVYSYDIIGAGRSGNCIRQLLEKLELPVRMVSHSGKGGCLPIEKWQKEPGDVVVNTAPISVYETMPFENWKKEITVIDISSMRLPAGELDAKYPNIHYFPAPPLPGTVAPKSAGELLGKFVLDILQ